MTYLQLVNKVMLRLREAEVTSSAETDYSKLVGEFVTEAISEVEDARDWNALRTTIIVSTAAGVVSYGLTGAGESYTIRNVFQDTNDYEIHKAPTAKWMTQNLLTTPLTTDQPQYYDVNGVDASNDPQVDLWPVPDAVYGVNFNMKIKTGDSPADATEILVPSLPIILRAYMHALDERGDDAGDSLAAIGIRYQRALDDAATYDAALNPDESIWYEE